MNGAVLVLNQNYEPLNVCNVKRALVLVIGGKAEVLEEEPRAIRTPQCSLHRAVGDPPASAWCAARARWSS